MIYYLKYEEKAGDEIKEWMGTCAYTRLDKVKSALSDLGYQEESGYWYKGKVNVFIESLELVEDED